MLLSSLCTSQKLLRSAAVPSSAKNAVCKASGVRNYSAGQQTGWCLCCGTPSFMCSPVKHSKVSAAESWSMLRSSKAHISTAQSKLLTQPYSAGESKHMIEQSRSQSTGKHVLEQARSQSFEKHMARNQSTNSDSDSESDSSNSSNSDASVSGKGGLDSDTTASDNIASAPSSSSSGSTNVVNGKDRRGIFLADSSKTISKHLNKILEGNKMWRKDKKENNPEYFEKLSRKQTPKFMYVGCSDSRVPANEILGLG